MNELDPRPKKVESQSSTEELFARLTSSSQSDQMTATDFIRARAEHILGDTFDSQDWKTFIVSRPHFTHTDKIILTGASAFISIVQQLKPTNVQLDFLVGTIIQQQTEKIIKKEKINRDSDLVIYKLVDEKRVVQPQQDPETRDARWKSLNEKVTSIGANLSEDEVADFQYLAELIFERGQAKQKTITKLNKGQFEEFWKDVRRKKRIQR